MSLSIYQSLNKTNQIHCILIVAIIAQEVRTQKSYCTMFTWYIPFDADMGLLRIFAPHSAFFFIFNLQVKPKNCELVSFSQHQNGPSPTSYRVKGCLVDSKSTLFWANWLCFSENSFNLLLFADPTWLCFNGFFFSLIKLPFLL